jgi:hypothetical protein
MPAPRTVVVRTTDTGEAWTMRVGEGRTMSRVGEPTAAEADVVDVRGTAAQIYLALWNRGDEISCNDRALLERWRSDVQVLW